MLTQYLDRPGAGYWLGWVRGAVKCVKLAGPSRSALYCTVLYCTVQGRAEVQVVPPTVALTSSSHPDISENTKH